MVRADSNMIDAACRGDHGALVNLLSVCQPDIKRFARRTCATTQDAEDAVQIALWQLYRKIGALRTTATFATWLFRIVERECFRLFKSGRHMESLDSANDTSLLTAAPKIPQDLQIDLCRAIERLSAAYREVLILRDVHELTTPEVASHLGLSIEAVKGRLHRARGVVREHLLASGYWMKDGLPESSNKNGGHDVLS